MKMAAPTASKAASLGCNNKPAFPELDFRSGARVEELNKLIQEFTRHDQREYDDQRALEIHTAKDFIFSMLGKENARSKTSRGQRVSVALRRSPGRCGGPGPR
ncbi:mCG125361, isoform CRA_b [Mus musculus]|nr:mCG125361, isoform CRA_b [Mus musculus]